MIKKTFFKGFQKAFFQRETMAIKTHFPDTY